MIFRSWGRPCPISGGALLFGGVEVCSLKKSTQWSIQSSSVCCLAQNRLPMARLIRTILSLLLILILLFTWASCPTVTAKALLTEITVVGGGALTLAALLDLLMVTFGAAGMDGAVRNQAAASGTQPVPYIGQLLNRFLAISLDGILPSVWSKPIQEGLSVLSNGTLYLDSAATAAIADFQRWAWSEAGANLIMFAPIKEGSDGILTDASGWQVQILDCTSESSAVPGYYVQQIGVSTGQTKFRWYAGSTSPCRVVAYVMTRDNTSGSVSFYPRVAWYEEPPSSGVIGLYRVHPTTGSVSAYPSTVSSTTPGFILTTGWLSNVEWTIPSIPEESAPSSFDLDSWDSGSDLVGDVDTFVGPMQQGQGTQLPLGDVVTVSSEAGARMHLLNYLRAAAAAYSGAGTADVPVTDVGTGEEELLPLSVPLDNPIGVTGVTDAAIDQSGAVAGTDAVAGDFSGTESYTMDLTQFFPFCIPFDLYALYQKFESEAAAPVVDWPIPMPGGGDPLLLHLDFSAFDELATWVRRLELIAFAVGLMIMTKHLIQGGD